MRRRKQGGVAETLLPDMLSYDPTRAAVFSEQWPYAYRRLSPMPFWLSSPTER